MALCLCFFRFAIVATFTKTWRWRCDIFSILPHKAIFHIRLNMSYIIMHFLRVLVILLTFSIIQRVLLLLVSVHVLPHFCGFSLYIIYNIDKWKIIIYINLCRFVWSHELCICKCNDYTDNLAIYAGIVTDINRRYDAYVVSVYRVI